MLASGQTALNFKKKYVRESKAGATDNIPLPESYKPETPIPTQPKIIVPQNDERLPEDDFKYVRNKLLLNQSAMLPQEPAPTPPKEPEKDKPTKKDIANQKLTELAGKADNVLLKVSTVFPFTFFVHDIIVDPYKVNVIFREFFWSEHIHSIMVKDILDVVVETSLFFATIKFVDQGYVENTINITYLKKEDALELRKVVQGLVIAHRQAVDLSVLNPTNIKDKATELGKVKGIDDSVISPNL